LETGGLSNLSKIGFGLEMSPSRHGMPVVMMASVMMAPNDEHEIRV
jgi:hypothetical protein